MKTMKNFVRKSYDKIIKYFDSTAPKEQDVQKNCYKRGLHHKQGRHDRAANKIVNSSCYYSKDIYGARIMNLD